MLLKESWPVFLKDYFSRPEHRLRAIAIAGACVLGFIAVLLGISIFRAIFTVPGVIRTNWGLGDFLVRSYGVLAFMIPVYFLGAAIILGDRMFRLDRLFILNGFVLPFFTLAIGFSIIRDFTVLSKQWEILDRIGKTGFSMLAVLLTVIESFLILALAPVFFPRLKDQSGAAKPGKTKDRSRLLTILEHHPLILRMFKQPDPVPAAETALSPAAPAYTNTAGVNAAPIPCPEPIPVMDADVELALAVAERDAARHGILVNAGVDEVDDEDEYETDIEAIEDGEDEFGETPESTGTFIFSLDSREGVTSVVLPRGITKIIPETGSPVPPAAEAPESRTGTGEFEGMPEKTTAPSMPARKKRGAYKIPVDGLLNQYPDGQYWIIDDATREAAVTLKETLKEFNIQAEVTGIKKGPVITMFEILPAPGVKLSKIVNLQDNIALRLAAASVRIVAPIPGKHAVGIEVPNVKRNIVSFKEIVEGDLQRDGKKEGRKQEIPVVLGKDITGEAVTVDLAQMPHLLIAGATGSGKSVCVNAMILSILYQRPPADCRLILIDPKIVELKLYNDIPHLLTSVITEPKRAFQALQYCIYEMERRYACLDSMGVRDIKSYNRRIKERGIATEHIPYIVVVIDEFADLMATTGKELESTVARLAAMSRAVGIHLVLATQRPSIDVITGLIKANIPSRIAFMVASKMDSRIIIDMVGAEKLLGKGDMLYAGVVDPFPIRMQGAFVSEEEVERVVEFVKTFGEPEYIDDEMFFDDEEDDLGPSLFEGGDDPLYEKALEIVIQQGKASASYIQRRLKIGYNRAARLVEEMEHQGVVGPAQGSRPRELLRGV
jgi:S-DNA-T family DNA segregation ATPase FtsK/SpoIIIE